MATSNNNSIVINQNELGGGVVTNGIFGAESLTPMGTFPNVPQFYKYSASKNSTDKLTLTLQKVKDQLRKQLNAENNTTFSNSTKDDSLIESYLVEYVSLLIDYTDLRNFVFYGSAYTELAHNIQTIVQNFPYKFLISTLSSTLSTPSAEFTFTDDVSANTTTFLINQSAIKDGIEEFNFFDNNLSFNWLDYDLVDNNGTRYPVTKVISPYNSPSIFQITGISNYAVTPTVGLPYTTLKIQTITTHNYFVGNSVNIFENILTNGITSKDDGTLDDNYLISQVISPTEFLIVSKYALNKLVASSDDLSDQAVSIPINYSVDDFGQVRLIPLSQNTKPYVTKMVVAGNVSLAQLTTYTDQSNNGFTGFILSKKQNIISDWEYNLTPVQRMLLAPAPVNPTPWPVRIVTNNIQHLLSDSTFSSAEQGFISWLQSPTNLYVPDVTPNADNDIAFSDTYTEYRLARALTLDETQTNQLVRRCVPQDMISELNDTTDGKFQRFVLIAGWFFDQIKVYVKFIKYVHHLNYGGFNQLSPEYYKYYADYYGFDLFSDDGINFSQLVVKTEPGFYFIQNKTSVIDPSSKYYKLTQKQLSYERQKRLLLSLFYLYKTKGTPGTINKLVSLLGAPDGFLLFNEYAFDIQNTDSFDYFGTGPNLKFSGKKVVDNQKIYVPQSHFEIDPNYPVPDPSMPPVYRMRLHNESTINLRTASVLTNPNGAVDTQIVNVFGQQKYNYGILKNGEFANLQSINSSYAYNQPYYGLPLSLPDKFAGMTVEYMIPRDGFKKGVGNNLDETSIHICSLYQISTTTVPNLINNIYPYTLPEMFSNFDYSSVRTFANDLTPKTDNSPNVASDFSELNRLFFNSNNISMTKPYVIVRLEGNDLVVRCRLQKETGAGTDIGERVAIHQGVFAADGLNHTLRLLFTPIGVEVFEDYSHLGVEAYSKLGIAEWLDPTTSGDGMPYCAFEIPKAKILTCSPLIYDGSVFFAYPDNTGTDTAQYWDLFIGYPSNVDFYFKRIAIEENYAVDSFDINDKITNPLNYTSEFYSFDFTDNDGDNTSFSIRSTFGPSEPDIANENETILPIEQVNNKLVVQKLKLTPKTFLTDYQGNRINQQRYFTRTQDFFNVVDPFADNAHSMTLHKDYYYENFHGKLTSLYALYSPQVLTFELLQSFLDLIEDNFKKVIKSFIPIVINISEFGRLVTNSKFYQEKVHYTNIEKQCQGIYIGDKAVLETRIYESETTIAKGVSLTISFLNPDLSNLIAPFTVAWAGTSLLTLGQVLLNMNNLSINTVYPKLQVQLTDGLLIFAIDTNWYSLNHAGMDVNQVAISISDGTHTYEKDFANGVVGNGITTCGFVKYSAPFRAQSGVYVYYGSENQPPRYIYYESEAKPPTYLD